MGMRPNSLSSNHYLCGVEVGGAINFCSLLDGEGSQLLLPLLVDKAADLVLLPEATSFGTYLRPLYAIDSILDTNFLFLSLQV